jgi:hypothetical protein
MLAKEAIIKSNEGKKEKMLNKVLEILKSDETKRALERGLRGLITIVAMALIGQLTNVKELVFLAPVLNAAAKYIRDKFGKDILI